MVGGGSMREELTSVDPPRSFGYRLKTIKGPLAPLVGPVEGKWIFTPRRDGTTVTWQWILHPKSGADLAGAAVVRQDMEGLCAPGARDDCLDDAGRLNVCMCRLFGLHAGTDVCTATFWLLDAPDSLVRTEQEEPGRHGPGCL